MSDGLPSNGHELARAGMIFYSLTLLETGLVIYMIRANSRAGSSWANFFHLDSTTKFRLVPITLLGIPHSMNC